MTDGAGAIRILHVDDEPAFADATATVLEREDDRFTVETATSTSEGLERLTTDEFDCVVSEYDMPGRNGIEFLESVREEYPDLPFILFTGKGSEEVASDAISAGATDYVRKEGGTEQYERLANRIGNTVEQYCTTRRAAELDRIRTLASDVDQALVRATSREEAETRVCEIFSESEPYLFAWIGEVDPETHRVEPRTSAGIEESYIDEITVRTDESPTVRGPVGTAIRERRVAVSQNVHEDPEFEPWRETAIERGCRAVAAVPLEQGNTLYGELVVYAGRSNAFDEHERELLGELGSDIASILHSFDIQRELREERDRRRALFENAPGPVVAGEIHENGTRHLITDVNDAFTDALGLDAEEVVGKDIAEVVVPEEERERHETFREWVTVGEPVVAEVERITAEGTREFLLNVIPYAAEDGSADGWYAWYTDITERKEQEAELAETNKVLRTILENLPMGVLVEDASRNILTVNQRLCDVLDVPIAAEDLVGRDCATAAEELKDLFAEPETFTAGIEEKIERRKPVRREELPLADGRTFQQDYIPYTLPEGDANLWIYRDVTDRKEQERALERQNRRLDEFASVVSHDLRNPLNVAQGHLELISEECTSDHLDTVARAHERMEALIEDLLTLAREGEDAAEIEAIALEDVIEQCWQNVETAEATLVLDAEQTIRADPGRLRQLLENLLRNAVEHGGERVTVRIGDLDDGFYIADTGPGIPEDEREHVFEAGYSTVAGGTGFGLNIVEQIAADHGWNVTITDGTDGGARFEITDVEKTTT